MDQVKLQTTVAILSSQVNDLRAEARDCKEVRESIAMRIVSLEKNMVKMLLLTSIGSGIVAILATIVLGRLFNA